MPHCIIEYSAGIEKQVAPENLLNAVNNGAIQSGLFERDDIKTRAIEFTTFQTGSEKKAFIHVTARILSGRTMEQKKELSNLILEQLKQLEIPSISLTVEVVEIEKSSYSKIVI